MRIFFEKLLISRFFQIKSMNAVFEFDSFPFRGREAPWQFFIQKRKLCNSSGVSETVFDCSSPKKHAGFQWHMGFQSSSLQEAFLEQNDELLNLFAKREKSFGSRQKKQILRDKPMQKKVSRLLVHVGNFWKPSENVSFACLKIVLYVFRRKFGAESEIYKKRTELQ